MAGGTSHIWQSFYTNAAIAVMKTIAAVATGSGAMLAEAIHSGADCSNQILLLLGVKRAAKPADASHPLGYGRSLYFWSFMVAMILFSLGGMFSIYEGVHKLQHPEPVSNVGWAIAVLLAAIGLEGYATYSNIVEMNGRRGAVPFFQYIRQTKESDLVVIFGENAAATSGLLAALLALVVAWQTGDPRYDAVGSLVVGIILVLVAIFLAVEVQSLLVGESADPGIATDLQALVTASPALSKLYNLITIQQGPGEVMLAAKVEANRGLSAEAAVAAVNELERALKTKRPEVKWSFVELDVAD